ncbi:MAG: glycosyltransferase family 2 protein [Lachnospiraceae bacterium]|nr:glycosyltransferase family 2 protein [Lachnospiraceae bacterium]
MTLYLIVPCYNEEEVLENSARTLLEKYDRLHKAGRIDEKSRIVLINDGSGDATAQIMSRLHEQDARISCIHFSANFGHQNAVLSGYHFAADKCDAAISIDADLQQDIEAIDLFLDEFEKGADVVYGVRNSRSTDGPFKKATSQIFYQLMKWFGTQTIPNHADYRLLSRRALQALAEYGEGNIYLRGLIPTLGFPSAIVHFDVKERTAGSSKYTLAKMLRLAADGITSFSIAPIHFVFMMGVLILLVSLIVMLVTFIDWLRGDVVSGWTTIVLSVWALGALQLIAIGIVGEYIGKNYIETKKRPRYLIESVEHTQE